VEHI